MRLPRFITSLLSFFNRGRELPSFSTRDDHVSWIGQGSIPNMSGVSINVETALSYSAVWCALTILSEGIASLPLVTYRRTESGRERAEDLEMFQVLATNPNPEMTPFLFFQALMISALTAKCGYAEPEFRNNGELKHLWLINPYAITPGRKDNRLVYYCNSDTKRVNRRRNWFEASEIFVLPGLSMEGIRGIDRIQKAAQSIGLALAAETYGAAYFGRGGSLKGYFEKLPGYKKLSSQARNDLVEEHEAYHENGYQHHKTKVLPDGYRFIRTSDNPDDAQAVPTRNHQVQEIARWFNIPVHRLKEHSRSTYNNISSEQISWVQDTLRPWAIKLEQEINKKLVPHHERVRVYAEFDFDSLLRTDLKTRMEAYAKAIGNAILSPNEVRAKENLNPYTGGDVKYHPANLVQIEGSEK